MDTVYGTKKYFQSLGDNDYYNRHNSPSNRVMVSFYDIFFLFFFIHFKWIDFQRIYIKIQKNLLLMSIKLETFQPVGFFFWQRYRRFHHH